MVYALILAVTAIGAATAYLAYRSRDVRKFLAGAFFVSGGIQLYLYLAGVSVPVVGTTLVQTPALSGVRSIVHFALFAATFYFGFVWQPRAARR